MILGDQLTAADLVPVFNGFLKDLDEVRIGILKHLYDFLKVGRRIENKKSSLFKTILKAWAVETVLSLNNRKQLVWVSPVEVNHPVFTVGVLSVMGKYFYILPRNLPVPWSPNSVEGGRCVA